MGKAEVVDQKLAEMQQAELEAKRAALEGAYDAGVAEGAASVPPAGGGLSQADVDTAVANATADLHAQVDELVQKLADEEADDMDREAKLAAAEQMKAAVVQKLAELQAVLNPAPAPQPEPQPEPVPEPAPEAPVEETPAPGEGSLS